MPSASTKIDATYLIMIGDRSISHTPPFILTYDIYNKNVHNCLIDSGASSNIMPKLVCARFNITPKSYPVHIVKLDITRVEVVGEIHSAP